MGRPHIETVSAVGHNRAAAARTAAAAAASADALAVWADLLLTLIDSVVLGAVWWAARRPARDPEHLAVLEARILVCVGASMALSLLLVATLAIARLTDAPRPEGAGLWLALAQNGVYALVNGWIAWRWRQRMRGGPSALVRAQLRLFADKLTSNLLLTAALCATLALQDAALAITVDAVAGVLLATLSAWWCAPVLALTWQRLCRGSVRLLEDPA